MRQTQQLWMTRQSPAQASNDAREQTVGMLCVCWPCSCPRPLAWLICLDDTVLPEQGLPRLTSGP